MDNVKHPGLIYLAQAHEAFVQWKSSRNSGLTHETFAACIQSMGAIPELAFYLIRNHGFHYDLPGKFMSDPIKRMIRLVSANQRWELFYVFQTVAAIRKKFGALIYYSNRHSCQHLHFLVVRLSQLTIKAVQHLMHYG